MLLLALLLLAADPAIYVQRIGAVPQADVDATVTALRAFYPARVEVLAEKPLPQSAYYPPRKRYRAEKLLVELEAWAPPDTLRIIGLTTVDISTEKDGIPDWGILGLGDMAGKPSVISTFRCKKTAKNAAHARERLAKVAVHEVGHTLGLDHCASDGCLMHDAEGKVRTVDTERDLCAKCRAKLAQRGIVIGAEASPWR